MPDDDYFPKIRSKKMRNEAITISIVSGKGGTGKTLLTTVLADELGNSDQKVLVIDFDFFLRGLTSLLYYHKSEPIEIIGNDECTFFEKLTKDDDRKLGIKKFRSFDILPSVRSIDQIVNYQLTMFEKNNLFKKFTVLICQLKKKYDIIFLDCRAGYDETIMIPHIYSDYTFCVEEDDNISRITTDNLIQHLNDLSLYQEMMKKVNNTPILRISNKVRDIANFEKIQNRSRSANDLGSIPFDIEVMNLFGCDDFWNGLNQTLYKNSIVKIWNRFDEKAKLNMQLYF